MEESGNLRRLLGLSGWLAAAVAVVWVVVVCCEQEEEPRPDPGKRLDASVRRLADRPADGVARAKGRSKVAGKSVRSDGEMTVGVKWDASSLYGMLGDVSPETASLAKRINSAFKAKDFDALMACVDDALKCKNPIVRAMMTSSLEHYAGYTSSAEDDPASYGSLKKGALNVASGWRRANAEDLERLRAVIPAASRFLDDENATVGNFAAKAWIAGMRRMDAGGTRLEATREFFTKGNAALLEEFGQMELLQVSAYCGLDNESESKAAWAQMLSDAIERPIDGDYETIARYMYKELMQEEYAGRASTGKTLAWMADVENFAKERYSDPEDVAELMNFAAGAGQDQFGERAREVFEEINSEFKTAQAAIQAANAISKVEKAVAEQYGDGEEAKEVLAKKIDEVVSKYKKWESETSKCSGQQCSGQQR